MNFKALAAVLVSLFITTSTLEYLQAQTRPMPPLNPASQQECNEFTRAYKIYLDALHLRYQTCSRANEKMPVTNWLPAFRCSDVQHRVIVNVPPACVPFSNDWDCAVNDFARLNNQCSSTARQNEFDNAQKKANDLDDALRKAMLDSGAGLPGAARNSVTQLAKWWAEQPNDATVSAMLKAMQTTGYARLANSVGTIFDSTKDPVSHAEQLALLFNRNGNLISREMTRVAIQNVARTGREAVDALDTELARFDSDVNNEIERARGSRAPEWKCFPNYNSCTAYCREANRLSTNGSWCSGICSEGGTGNRPTPREFGRQNCYVPQ
jgi:hypothetical protein